MTRKITFIVVLLLLVICSILVIFGTQKFILDKFETVNELKEKKDELDKNYVALEKAISSDLPNKKRILESTIEQYKTTKSEYETLLAQYSILNASQSMEEEAEKDVYDVEFLWTIIGNYATEEGINLKFDITPNTTSPLSYNNSDKDYVVCDLKFSVTGPYINLTDFVYDIEDDDRLNFEINNFNMVRNETEVDTEPLNAQFTVFAVKITKNNLIENYPIISDTNYNNGDEINTNNDNSNENNNGNSTNTTNSTNTANTTNTTNTTKKSSNTTSNTNAKN